MLELAPSLELASSLELAPPSGTSCMNSRHYLNRPHPKKTWYGGGGQIPKLNINCFCCASKSLLVPHKTLQKNPPTLAVFISCLYILQNIKLLTQKFTLISKFQVSGVCLALRRPKFYFHGTHWCRMLFFLSKEAFRAPRHFSCV